MRRTMKERRLERRLVWIMAVALLVIAATIPASAQLSVTISIGDAILPPQGITTLPIMITDVPPNNVSTALINLTYNSTVVEILGVGSSDFNEFDYTDSLNGKVRMIGWQNLSPPSLPGPITFAQVTFRAIGNPGDCTPLNLEGDVGRPTGGPYVLNFSNGSITIVEGVPAYNSIGALTLIGMLALVLAIAVRKR
jgi:hypothetical protein